MADDTGKDEVTKDVLAPAVESGPREDLILTAIKFLQNPKVRQSPLSQRKLFLEKKGLTKAEIDAAVERSGIKEDDASRVYQSPVPLQPGAVPLQPGAEFLSPYILGKPSHGDRLDRVEKTVNDLQSNVVETLAKISQTLGALQEMITQHQLKMESLSQQVYTKQGLGDQLHPRSNRSDESLLRSQDHQLATEIKSELTSIKGLLLNRRQFPPTPSTKSLPAWQLDSTNTSASSSTTPTRSLVLPPSGDADNISKEAILNSNESGRDSQEDETMQTDVQFSTRSLVDQEGKENTSQQTFTGDKNMDISSEKNVKFENQEVKRENVPNGITEESTYSDNELD
ncbi:hypothetical protein KUTeg_001406 [Tegillarca granosa]|uniref:Peroxisomal membrane protein PEX14 n=1 Tax=Tegillarca granosa TaxID=220873 RepID=A0ABQ9FRB3_TEGGR|nr:hypothetical protein KUTeg_001406 [Tegillarca granosa]